MILIGIGANLPSKRYGTPVQTCEAALHALDRVDGVRVVRRSRWFESAPVPISDQPWYVNGVCIIETGLEPGALLDIMHHIEADFGRVRSEKNAPRVLDLDLLAYDDFITGEAAEMQVPHPRLHERAFVLFPLQDLVPGWVHPKMGQTLETMVAVLSQDQIARPLEMRHEPDGDSYDED